MMKRLILFLWVPVCLLAACNQAEMAEMDRRVTELEQRQQALSRQLQDIEKDVNALSALMDAYAKGFHVTSVEEVRKDGAIMGWNVSFDRHPSILLRNGADGRNGYVGVDGPDGVPGRTGNSPQVGVTRSDGAWYWTVDGQLLRDASGQPVPASASSSETQAKDGLTPVITIENGIWVVTVGGTRTEWTAVSTTEAVVEDGIFSSVATSGNQVNVTLKDGTLLQLPLQQAFSITLSKVSDRVLSYQAVGAVAAVTVSIIGDGAWQVGVSASSGSAGTVSLTAPSPLTDARFLLLATDGSNQTTASFIITDGIINL